jgi:trehalose/maltose hydrolase-like predicted phosphorylase
LPIDLVIGREHTQRSQVVKQADVALIALLPEEFPGSMAEANFSYYQLRYAHGSSLSAVESGGDSRREGRVCSSS